MAELKASVWAAAARATAPGVPVGIVSHPSTARALRERGFQVEKAYGPGYILYGAKETAP